MKTAVILALSFAFSIQLIPAQQDPAAAEILDRFATKARSDFPLNIKFEYVFESLTDHETHNQNGTLILDQDKYHLILDDAEVISDGETLWNHVISAEEVYISDAGAPSPDDEFFFSNPQQIFTFYKKDFKYRLTGEIEFQDRKYHQIDLFPVDLNKSYHTVTLLIDQVDQHLFSIETRGKQGINHTIRITDYKTREKVSPDMFQFDARKYPGIEVIDTRL